MMITLPDQRRLDLDRLAASDLFALTGPAARLCRWSGLTDQFYSLAQHGLLVAEIVSHDKEIGNLLKFDDRLRLICRIQALLAPLAAVIRQGDSPLIGSILNPSSPYNSDLARAVDIEPNQLTNRAVTLAEEIATATEIRDLTNLKLTRKPWPKMIQPLLPLEAECRLTEALRAALPSAPPALGPDSLAIPEPRHFFRKEVA